MNNIIIGPFETKSNLGLIAISDKHIYIIKLNFASTFKYSISQQIPFLYSNYFDKLIARPLRELTSQFSTHQLNIDETLNVQLKRSKIWKHSIIINSADLNIKWNILKRYETDNYEKILSNSLNTRFSSEIK